MAEYCLTCFNKFINTNKPLTENDVVLNYDICESCKQNKLCISFIINKSSNT